MVMLSYVAEVDVHDPEYHGDGELDGEDGEKPLGGVHVGLHPLLEEVAMKTLHILLWDTVHSEWGIVDECKKTV